MNIKDITFTSIDTVDVFTPNFGTYKYQCDEVQDFTFSSSQDNTNLTGANGSVIGMLKRNPSVGIKFTTGMVSAGLLADEFGTEVENGATTVVWTDHTTISGDKATLNFKPVDGVYKVFVGANIYDVAETAEAGKTVVYTEATEDSPATLTFETDEWVNGTEVAVKYSRTITTDTVERRADSVSENVAIVITGQWEDRCHVVRKYQCSVPVVAPTGTFDLAIGTSQTTMPFDGTACATSCTGKNVLAKWDFFDGEAEDVILTA